MGKKVLWRNSFQRSVGGVSPDDEKGGIVDGHGAEAGIRGAVSDDEAIFCIKNGLSWLIILCFHFFIKTVNYKKVLD